MTQYTTTNYLAHNGLPMAAIREFVSQRGHRSYSYLTEEKGQLVTRDANWPRERALEAHERLIAAGFFPSEGERCLTV